MSVDGSDHYLADSLFLPSPRNSYDWIELQCALIESRLSDFFFKTGTISIILRAFENWKFKQSLTKMIARWMTWQDFPLKRTFYFWKLWLLSRASWSQYLSDIILWYHSCQYCKAVPENSISFQLLLLAKDYQWCVRKYRFAIYWKNIAQLNQNHV